MSYLSFSLLYIILYSIIMCFMSNFNVILVKFKYYKNFYSTYVSYILSISIYKIIYIRNISIKSLQIIYYTAFTSIFYRDRFG